MFEETLQPFVDVSAPAAVGYVLANQASIARLRDDPTRAEALLDESAAQFDELQDERGAASVAVRRAYLELSKGSTDAARALLERALEIRTAQSDRRGVGLVLSGLGLVETIAGNDDEAERLLADARALFRRAGDRWGLASTLWRTGELWRAQDRLDEAWTALQEARQVLVETNRERWLGHADAALAEVASLRERTRAGALAVRGRASGTTRPRTTCREQPRSSARLLVLAKAPQSSRKGAAVRTSVTRSKKGRTT